MTYKIKSKYSDKCLNIYGENIKSLRNNKNICLWSDTGTDEQKWEIVTSNGISYIKSHIDTEYGLNVFRSRKLWNCDVHIIKGNEKDAKLILEQNDSYFKIKLAEYPGFCLTAGGMTNGANVYWDDNDVSDKQLWSISECDGKILNMPVNTNQKYRSNPEWIRSYGCAVCCEADVASYYDSSKNYSI